MAITPIQSGAAVLKSMPLVQNTKPVFQEKFNIGNKMPGMMSMQFNNQYGKGVTGAIVDIKS